MKKAVGCRDRVCGGEVAAGQYRRQRTMPFEDCIRQGAECGGRRRGVASKPGRAPDIRHALPSRQQGVVGGQRREGALLGPHLIERVVGCGFQRETDRQRVAQCAAHLVVVEERERHATCLLRRMTQVGQPRAKQAVANLEPMVEKAERPIDCQRRKPQRQPSKLDGHRIQVNSVQAPFRDRATNARSFSRSQVGGMTHARADERRFVGGREIPARRHQKGAAPHRRIDDAKLKDLVGCGVPDQRCERAPDQVVGDRLWRVEGPGRLADPGSAFQADSRRLNLWLVVEQRFIDRTELFHAEVSVGDSFASRSIRRGS